MRFLLAALLALDPGGVELPPQQAGTVNVHGMVQPAETGPAPGLAQVRLTFHAESPAGLHVDAPRLEDALAAWRVTRLASSWSQVGAGTRWELTLWLEQVKPGLAPLPGIVLRLREGSEKTWQEVSWHDLLHEPREVPDIIELPPPPPSPWPTRLLVLGLSLGALLLLALVVRIGRQPRARPLPPPLHERLLARLAVPGSDPASQLAEVLRDGLAERFTVETRARTSGEVLASLEESVGNDPVLTALFAWCDEVKFAGRTPSLDEVGNRYEQARQFVLHRMVRSEQGGESGEITAREQSG